MSGQAQQNTNGEYCTLAEELVNYLNKQQTQKQHSSVNINSFNLLTIIGQGNYAKVSLVRKKDDGQIYALKTLKRKHIKHQVQMNHILTERNILKVVDSQYIVRCKYAFQDKKRLFFALEFCQGGELFTLIKTKGFLNENPAKFYAAQIVKALEYLHSLNIIYRDLKPENVLIDQEGYIKLTDFGLSKILQNDNEVATSVAGTPEYLAPEILSEKGHGKASDWWTLGNIIYEMVTGLPPFYDPNREKLFGNILTQPVKFDPRIQGNLKDLLSGLLQKDPNKRLGSKYGALEIINHPWFSDLNWESLRLRKIIPPFKPKVDNEIDVSYFSPDFLEMEFSPNDEPGSLSQPSIQGFSISNTQNSSVMASYIIENNNYQNVVNKEEQEQMETENDYQFVHEAQNTASYQQVIKEIESQIDSQNDFELKE
ncbi:Serine/Threonine kinase domain protein (macronuclear) [Tetrahymena thermophila SB210]|uniref:Serine/Threonine kinase domain protein n=1 Tax=Tetrahymena thermophila (strain SB210) TaxID=312017 RepID=I7MG69_TETTS|nr:Serine/Threonine kinase domain protein [Tetrahymena thermophila SB210]EAR84905.2 Serine/Threonine kinase domain protein [Tetrahymena thermophila SB210]|eukprot:XP_001032568.2 Serine/Threonine kinase domain protein [Tetrahymena thermophila SB210]